MKVKTKTCKYCNETKPVYLFTINRKTVDGLTSRCSECLTKKKKSKPSELDILRKNVPPITENYWTKNI